jgi:hypothetical protein
MGGGAEGISNYQKRIVSLLINCYSFQQLIDLNFTEIAIGLYEFDSQKLFELLIASAHHGSVVFQINLFARFDGIECFEGDVFGITET